MVPVSRASDKPPMTHVSTREYHENENTRFWGTMDHCMDKLANKIPLSDTNPISYINPARTVFSK